VILTQVDIAGLRNLQPTTLLPAAGFNLITGANGAGKSSLLEAIQCLSVGHSFRTRKARELIAHGQDEYTLACQMTDETGQQTHRCGLRRGRDGSTELRLDYEEIRSIALITQLLPIKALTPDSHRLIQDGPTGRRQFLDWGVFHMEQSFFQAWKLYRRSLSQRNQALRDQAPDTEVTSWDDQLAESGTTLDRLRLQYLEKLQVSVETILRAMDTVFHVKLRYRSGWAEDVSLADALARNLGNCRRFRTTTDGPHRAELVVETQGVLARQVLSRGQQKVLVYALHLAQLAVLHQQTHRRAVVLCDDLMSELDTDHRSRMLDQLLAFDSQLFITETQPDRTATTPSARFHVEHGVVEKIV